MLAGNEVEALKLYSTNFQKCLASGSAGPDLENEVLPTCQLTDDDHNLLKTFCNIVTELKYNYCPICKEYFPLVTLNNKSSYCYRYRRDKLIPKRFSQENDIDPGEVPAKLSRFSRENINFTDSFVPNPISRVTEESITYNEINNLINSDNIAQINWPTIGDISINEFKNTSYIIKAFPTLFLTRNADLH
ncbi:9950_t:CDS:2, partial [Gigaspora margarita]